MPKIQPFKMNAGSAPQVLERYAALVGGVWANNILRVDHDQVRLTSYLYDEIPGVEVSVHFARFAEDQVIETIASSKPVILAQFIEESIFFKEGPYIAGLGPGQVHGAMLYHSGMSLRYTIQKGKPVRWSTIRFTPAMWNKLSTHHWNNLDQLINDPSPWVLYETLTYPMENCLRELFDIQATEFGRRAYSLSKGLELVTLFMERIINRQDEEDQIGLLNMDVETLFAVKDELIQNLANPPGMGELARKFAVSETKLRSNFKTMYGLPPHQFLLRERYRQAYKRVLYSDESLTRIAHELGFSSSGHFSEGFKQHFGKTPTAIRKNVG